MENLKRNIILIGLMGAGKTTVGKRLAECLSYHFQDTDLLLEQRTKDTISHIFTEHGEEYFRDMETNLLKELLPSLEHTVLSTGGGLPLREQNASLLRQMGYIVFLKTGKHTAIERLKGDTTRPLLQGEELEQKVEGLLKFRTPIYERTAHAIIETDGKTVEEIVASIVELN